MGGWMGGWVGGWMDGWGEAFRFIHSLIHVYTHTRIYRQMPGGYGTFLMRKLGTLMWTEDFAPGSSILFDDLWIRPTGRWLYPVHSFYPEVEDLTKATVTYGPHVDAR